MVRSGSGPGAAQWLSALPTCPETTMSAEVLQTCLRRRLRLPLLMQTARCPAGGCRRRLDELGDHLASCSHTGTLQRRAKPVERAWQRVFREAGGRVLPQARLCDLDLRPRIPTTDGRRVDLVARGLPLFGGLPLCGDAALVSALHADGSPWRYADLQDGVALQRTDEQHRQQYHELCSSNRAHFVMLGAELGGRLSAEASHMLRQLAAAKAREAPQLLRRSVEFAWHRRWLTLVSVAIQVATAESLLEPTSSHKTEVDGHTPCWTELPGRDCPACSRLPLR